MDLMNLARLVQEVVDGEPPKALLNYCDNYYQPYYFLLHLLALHTNKPCVELGVEKGRGSYAMCLTGREVYGIDHHRQGEIAVVQDIFPNFTFLEQSSLPIPSTIENLTENIGVLHVDTEHSYAQAREEFWAYKPLLNIPAVVCFDDTHAMNNGVMEFIMTLPWPKIFDDRLHSPGYCVMLYLGDDWK